MSQIKLYIALGCVILILGGGYTIKYLSDRVDTLKTEKAILEAQNEKIAQEANRYANRPRTPTDTDNRLCKWARYIDERDNGKPKRGVPVRPCP